MIEIVKETVTSHDYYIIITDYMLRIKSSIREFGTCPTLIREIKAKLLLFGAEVDF